MSVDNKEKKFNDYLQQHNAIKFFRAAVDLFFPDHFRLDQSNYENKRREIIGWLKKECLLNEQLQNLQLLVDKLSMSEFAEMYFYPASSEFGQKAILFLSTVREFLQDKNVEVQEEVRKRFEKDFYSDSFVYVAEVLKGEVEEVVRENKINSATALKEKITELKGKLYNDGIFYYINIYNIFYILDVSFMQSVFPFEGGKDVRLRRDTFTEFLNQKVQDIFGEVSRKYREFQFILDTLNKENISEANSNNREQRRSFLSREKIEDPRNKWYWTFKQCVKSGPVTQNLKFHLLEGKFLTTLNQYNELSQNKPKARERSGSTTGGLVSGLKSVAQKVSNKNRKRTQQFINWLIQDYKVGTGQASTNLSNENLAGLLLILSALMEALRNTSVSIGQGLGNEFARYLVTATWNTFEIDADTKISDNNDDSKKVLDDNLTYLQQLLMLQAFVVCPQVFNNPIIKAIADFIEYPIKQEPDKRSHKKKIEFAYQVISKVLQAKTEQDYVWIFDKINEGIILSRSSGKDEEKSTGLEDHLIKLRDALILAMIEKKLKPEAKEFSLKSLLEIYSKISAPLVKKSEELIEFSEQAMPLLQFIAEEHPEIIEKEFTALYTAFINLHNKTPEAKNGLKFDKESYLKSRLEKAVVLVDMLSKNYEKKNNSLDKTPQPIINFRDELRKIVMTYNSKFISLENKVDIGPLISRPQPIIATKSSSPDVTADLDDLMADLAQKKQERDRKQQQQTLDPEMQFLVQPSTMSSPLSSPPPIQFHSEISNCNNNATGTEQLQTRPNRARSRAVSTHRPTFPFDAETSSTDSSSNPTPPQQ